MQKRFRRSELELRGPRNGLKSGRGTHSTPLSAHVPYLPTNPGIEGVRSREITHSRTPIRNPPIRNPRN
eukprot:8389276-Alexandrium_andersonii.AAC.1